jgi:hypothetical protein
MLQRSLMTKVVMSHLVLVLPADSKVRRTCMDQRADLRSYRSISRDGDTRRGKWPSKSRLLGNYSYRSQCSVIQYERTKYQAHMSVSETESPGAKVMADAPKSNKEHGPAMFSTSCLLAVPHPMYIFPALTFLFFYAPRCRSSTNNPSTFKLYR